MTCPIATRVKSLLNIVFFDISFCYPLIKPTVGLYVSKIKLLPPEQFISSHCLYFSVICPDFCSSLL